MATKIKGTGIATGAIDSTQLATLSGHFDLLDSNNIRLGNSQDLKLYHHSNHGYIENNTGTLFIDGAAVSILDGSNTSASFIPAGATTLYHAGTARIATSSSGVAVTGNVAVTGSNGVIDIATSGNEINFSRNAANYLNATGASASLVFLTNNSTALTLNSGQNATFAGNVVVTGDLTVNGTNTTLNVSTLEVEDKAITVAKGAANASAANESGLIVAGASANMLYLSAGDEFRFNKPTYVDAGYKTGTTSTFVGQLTNSGGKLRLQSDANRDIEIGDTNNADIVYVDTSEQHVGIGVSSPSKKLHVEDSSAYQLQVDGGNNFWNVGAGWSGYYDGSFLIANNTGDKLVIDPNGKVGIGVNGPSYPLDVQTSSGHSYIRTKSTASNTRAALLTTGEDSGGNEVKGYFGSVGDANEVEIASLSNHQLKFYVNNTPAKGMIIDTDGKVGIGASSPAAVLEVKASNTGTSDWANKGIMSSVQINTANRTFGGLTMVDHGSGSGHAGLGFRYDGTGYKLELGTASSTSSGISTHLTIDRLGAIVTSGHLDIGNELTIPHKVIHAGDTNTYLEFNANDSWRVVTGNEERIKANNGEVVINDNSVDMDFRVESNASTHQLFVDSTNSKVLVSSNNTASVTDSASALAARAFEVNGNASEGSDNLSIFAMADGTGNYGIEVSNSPHTAQYDLLLNPIKGGNVGIGLTNPAALLHVNGSGDAVRVTSTNTGSGGAQVDLLHFTSSPADNDIHAMINMGGYYSGTSSAYGSSIRSVWTNAGAKEAKLEFFTRDDSDFVARMVIDKDGHVGIGETSPDSPLHVVGRLHHKRSTGTTHTGASSTSRAISDVSIIGSKLRWSLEVYFANGASGYGIRVYVAQTSLWMAGEVCIGSTYSNASATGLNRYSFSHNYNGSNNYGNVLTQTESYGQVASHFNFEGHGWDSTESAHYFEFRHNQSTGNHMYLQFEGIGSTPAHANMATWYYKHITF